MDDLQPIPLSVRSAKFTTKLEAMLSNPFTSDIIAWMPHGKSWKIIDPILFYREVMPEYFEYCNYTSFNRLVNAWGFQMIKNGPDRNCYYHKFFCRDMPHLHKQMCRLSLKKKKHVFK